VLPKETTKTLIGAGTAEADGQRIPASKQTNSATRRWVRGNVPDDGQAATIPNPFLPALKSRRLLYKGGNYIPPEVCKVNIWLTIFTNGAITYDKSIASLDRIFYTKPTVEKVAEGQSEQANEKLEVGMAHANGESGAKGIPVPRSAALRHHSACGGGSV
jgi:hypothetical protein